MQEYEDVRSAPSHGFWIHICRVNVFLSCPMEGNFLKLNTHQLQNLGFKRIRSSCHVKHHVSSKDQSLWSSKCPLGSSTVLATAYSLLKPWSRRSDGWSPYIASQCNTGWMAATGRDGWKECPHWLGREVSFLLRWNSPEDLDAKRPARLLGMSTISKLIW